MEELRTLVMVVIFMSDAKKELEWKTRKERIDTKLVTLGWDIINYKSVTNNSRLIHHAVYEYETATGPADYAFFVNGRLLGFMEAKKVSTNPQEVLEQAKRYSRGAFEGIGNWGGYRVPLLYSSNGEKIWFLDIRDEKNIRREIKDYHTPSAMNEIYDRNINIALNKLKNIKIKENSKLRHYQAKAITDTETAIIAKKRQMLIAMATGTGKTFLTVSQIYRFLKSGLGRRVLFLVDRKALAAQAVRTFASFDTPIGLKFDTEFEVYSQSFRKEDFGDDDTFNPKTLPNEYLTKPGKEHTFVYVCTIQRMAVNLYGKDAISAESLEFEGDISDGATLDIPIHAFDVIIADECHRGYTSKETSTWRNVIDYFDAIKIGLTATPAPHSLSLFKEVVSRYTTEQAIEDGYLVDYEAVKIKSGVKINGVFLREGEHVGVIDKTTGKEIYDELEDEREYKSSEVESKITVPDTNRKIIQELAKYAAIHEEQTGHFPKILIFAANDLQHTSHADQVVRICREVFNQGDAFVQKITGSPSVDRPLQRIREFRNRPKPAIVVTVDMLSTGVDVPAIEYVVFMRPVKSRILWTQMLGRGTRLCPEINKSHFTIFDCFDGSLIEYFKNTTEFTIEPPQKEAVSLEQVIENIYKNNDREYYTNVLVKRLRRIEKNMSGEAREKFSDYIDDGDIGKFAGELKQKIKHDFTNVMKLLKDKTFQELLLNYPRGQSSFVIAYDTVDTVSSEWVFRVAEDYVKPEDYLVSFERFVKENPEHIEAIEILLKRPKDWKTESLNELRAKLKKNLFSETDLQKAYKIVYSKALADIISIVKHSALKESQILTAQERVEIVMRKIMSANNFTPEQIKWLELIREHLIENLTVDIEDFEVMPVFTRQGGKAKARKIFNGEFDKLIKELNELIAS
jgi:type I restriction enzyme, R subunit